MLDILMKMLCSIVTFLFPVFASYKALKANDPAQVTPWLMYWVVIACILVVESWTEWFLRWIPFYYNLRALFMLWLVAPQTQGATKLYLEHVHPTLTKHELEIEDLISRTHDQLKVMGMEYLNQAIRKGEEVFFGIKRTETPPSPQGQPMSYANTLLSRFRVPPISPYGSQVATDFYHILSSALQQQVTSKAGDEASSVASRMLPEGLKGKDEKAQYLEAQKKRLQAVMEALDKETAQLSSGGGEDVSSSSAAGVVQAGLEASGFYKSPSQATLTGGDFDHVDKSEAEGAGWWGGWGGKQEASVGKSTAVEK